MTFETELTTKISKGTQEFFRVTLIQFTLEYSRLGNMALLNQIIMPSPFPGFDPFLEIPAYWPDFHSTFINYWREAIADLLPENYEASLDERVCLIEHESDARKLVSPDITVTSVYEQRTPTASASAAVLETTTLEPVNIPLTILDGPSETYIQILYRPDQSVVTTLELLSPANMNLPGRTDYLIKRNAILLQPVHLVELDLLRRGHRVPFDKPIPQADYFYFVSRFEQRPNCQVYHWNMPQPLPTLPIPLRDPDIRVSLAGVFNTAFERGRFYRRINYQQALPGTLSDAEAQWVKQHIQPSEA